MTQQIIIASQVLPSRQPGDCVVVRTPLDLIHAIEVRADVGTVILADAFAAQPGVREFLRDEYPWLRIVTMESPRHFHRDRITVLGSYSV
jgi:hypothetical protein